MADRPPIVFLPGVMGSRLYFPNADKFWDPDSTWRMLRWLPVRFLRSDDDNRRELHASQPARVMIDPLSRASMTEEEIRLGWGGVVFSFYDEFLRGLRDLDGGRRVHAIGYDWRQDIRWLGAHVAGKLSRLLEQTGAEKLSLATHSMGGLVARAALRHDPSLIPRVDKFVSICQPAAGAVILYRRLFTGLVRNLDGGGGIGDRAFRLLLGNDRAAFLGNMSGLPGAMQLIPSGHFPADAQSRPWHRGINGQATHADLYGHSQSPPGLLDAALGLAREVRDDLEDRIENVTDFHEWLGPPSPLADDWPETWAICGVGHATEVQFGFETDPLRPTVTPNGDGTVPLLSARSLGVDEERLSVISGVEHGKACLNGDVRRLAQAIL